MLRLSAWAYGVVFLLLGLRTAFWMPEHASQAGIAWVGVEGLVNLRAVHAGLHLAIGVFILICARFRVHSIGILAGALATTGLAMVRTAGMLADHAVTTHQFVLLGPEIIGVAVGVAFVPRIVSDLRRFAASSRSTGTA